MGALIIAGSDPYSLDNGQLQLFQGFLFVDGPATHTIDADVVQRQSGNWSVSGSSELIINGMLDGIHTLSKTGAGDLILNSSNPFDGQSRILQGQIVLGHADALMNSTVNLQASNGLDITTNGIDANVKGLTGDGSLSLGSQQLTTRSGGSSTTYAGVITGNIDSKLLHNGFGTLILSGGSPETPSSFGSLRTENGLVEVDGGHLSLTSLDLVAATNAALSVSNSAITLRNGATVQLAADSASNIDQSTLTVTGSGTALTGSRMETIATSNIVVEEGASLDMTGDLLIGPTGDGDVTIQTGATVSSDSLILGGPSANTGAALVTGSGTQLTTNQLNLGGNSAGMTGGSVDVTVSDGATVQVAGETKFWNSSGSISISGATLETDTLTQEGSVNGILHISDNAGGDAALVVGTHNGSDVFDGLIMDGSDGPGSLRKTGTGTITLSGPNIYTGETIVDNGTLLVDGNIRSATINTGGTLALTIDNGVSDTITLNGGNLQASGSSLSIDNTLAINGDFGVVGTEDVTIDSTIELSADRSVTITNSGNTVFSGVISGNGGLTKEGASTLQLTANSTRSGSTQVYAGVLEIAGGAMSSSQTTIAASAALRVSAGIFDANGTVTNNGSLNVELGATMLGEGAAGNSSARDGQPRNTINSSGVLELENGANIDLSGGNGFVSVLVAGSGGLGGSLVVTDGVATLRGTATANGGESGGRSNDSSRKRGGRGGVLDVSGGTASILGSAVLDFNGGSAGPLGTSGRGGSVSVSDGDASISGSAVVNLMGGAAQGSSPFFSSNAPGGHGGSVNVLGGTLSIIENAVVNLNGANGRNWSRQISNPGPPPTYREINPTAGGAGGDLELSGGTTSISGAAIINLSGGHGGDGAPFTNGANGANGGQGGSVSLSNGQVNMTGGQINLNGGAGGSGVFETRNGSSGAAGSININGGLFNLTGGLVSGVASPSLSADPISLVMATVAITDGGTLNFNDDVTVDGGLVTRDGTSHLNVANNKTLTAINNAQIDLFDNTYLITGGKTLEITDGSSLTVEIFLGVGLESSGTLLVDNATVETGNITDGPFNAPWAVGVGHADITLRNNAVANFGNHVNFVGSGAPGHSGTLRVQSGADMTVHNFRIAGNSSGNGNVLVDGDGTTLTQIGAATFDLGASSFNTATLDVTNNAVYTTGTGPIVIKPTGILTVDTGATFNAQGNTTIDGTVNLASGLIDATTINLNPGGAFNFTGGRLHFDNFNGSLVQDGGSTSPGHSIGVSSVSED